MHEYDQIKMELVQVFDNFKLSMIEEEYHPDSFGSAYSTYTDRQKCTYRIIWDGKDGAGYVQTREETSWTDICPSIPESSTSNFWNALTIARIKLAEHIALTKLNA